MKKGKKWHEYQSIYLMGWLSIASPIWWLALVVNYAINRTEFFDRKVIAFFGLIWMVAFAIIAAFVVLAIIASIIE